jgi:hypothetical protein
VRRMAVLGVPFAAGLLVVLPPPSDDHAYGPAGGVVVSVGDGVGVFVAVGVAVSVGDGAGDGVTLVVGVGAGPPPPPPTEALVPGTPGTPALDRAGWLAARVDPNAGVDGAGHDA